jgi:hypothetical protein
MLGGASIRSGPIMNNPTSTLSLKEDIVVRIEQHVYDHLTKACGVQDGTHIVSISHPLSKTTANVCNNFLVFNIIKSMIHVDYFCEWRM